MSRDRLRDALRPLAEPQGLKDWAHKLREREIRSGGKGLTAFQRNAWREALGLPLTEPANPQNQEQV
jgi:hypothetical protein